MQKILFSKVVLTSVASAAIRLAATFYGIYFLFEYSTLEVFNLWHQLTFIASITLPLSLGGYGLAVINSVKDEARAERVNSAARLVTCILVILTSPFAIPSIARQASLWLVGDANATLFLQTTSLMLFCQSVYMSSYVNDVRKGYALRALIREALYSIGPLLTIWAAIFSDNWDVFILLVPFSVLLSLLAGVRGSISLQFRFPRRVNLSQKLLTLKSESRFAALVILNSTLVPAALLVIRAKLLRLGFQEDMAEFFAVQKVTAACALPIVVLQGAYLARRLVGVSNAEVLTFILKIQLLLACYFLLACLALYPLRDYLSLFLFSGGLTMSAKMVLGMSLCELMRLCGSVANQFHISNGRLMWYVACEFSYFLGLSLGLLLAVKSVHDLLLALVVSSAAYSLIATTSIYLTSKKCDLPRVF